MLYLKGFYMIKLISLIMLLSIELLLSANITELSAGNSISDDIQKLEKRYYKINLPKQQNIQVTLEDLDDDLDLYLQRGKLPTLTSYDCRSIKSKTNNELCNYEPQDDSIIYILVYGFKASHYTLKVNNTKNEPTLIELNKEVTNSLEQDKSHQYNIKGKKGDIYKIELYNLTNDGDLRVKLGSKAGLHHFDCKSINGNRSNDECTINFHQDSTLYIHVYGYRNTDYSLKVKKLIPNPQEKETHLFILGGQSNSAGISAFDGGRDYPEGVFQVVRDNYSKNTKDGDVVQAKSPLSHYTRAHGSMGFQIEFAYAYQKKFPNVTLIFIPCARGGSSFYKGQWLKGGVNYNDLVSRTNRLMQQHPEYKLKGMLWHQGESDTPYADTYRDNLDKTFDDFKNDIPRWDSSFITVMGTMVPRWQEMREERMKVRDIQKDCKNFIPNCGTALSSEPYRLDYYQDQYVHFNAESLREFGKRYFRQYIEILNR